MKRTAIIALMVLIVVPLAYSESLWVQAVDGLNIRESPSTDAKRIGQAPYGQKVELIDSMKSWARVTWNGISGWVFRDYLSPYDVIPLSQITILKPSVRRNCGEWIHIKYPFLSNDTLFDYEDVPEKNYTQQIDASGNYRVIAMDIGETGRWTMKGNKIHMDATYYTEEGDEGHASRDLSVWFYRVRDDWVVREAFLKNTDGSTDVEFLIQPVSVAAYKLTSDHQY